MKNRQKFINAIHYKAGLMTEGYKVICESHINHDKYFCSLRHSKNGNWFFIRVSDKEAAVYKNGRLHQPL